MAQYKTTQPMRRAFNFTRDDAPATPLNRRFSQIPEKKKVWGCDRTTFWSMLLLFTMIVVGISVGLAAAILSSGRHHR